MLNRAWGAANVECRLGVNTSKIALGLSTSNNFLPPGHIFEEGGGCTRKKPIKSARRNRDIHKCILLKRRNIELAYELQSVEISVYREIKSLPSGGRNRSSSHQLIRTNGSPLLKPDKSGQLAARGNRSHNELSSIGARPVIGRKGIVLNKDLVLGGDVAVSGMSLKELDIFVGIIGRPELIEVPVHIGEPRAFGHVGGSHIAANPVALVALLNSHGNKVIHF